ncbi:DNA repair exonuclease [Planoprotostelium fungivorum]|uniref:Double-strand break repair protein n=1 Tax=Planoprotostelium fungivorum TaxID=1890364 RepID=A0A2P6MRW7_9EUKA|nr:DNA repair exonuclease [Planoprotostelium fungivorum]
MGDDNTFRILVATDNHLGYLEKDPIRGNDSFITFEEILQHAKNLEVDFILLGGDMFHDNKPTRQTLYRTMELLRTYCFGNRPVNIEILSDQSINFATKFGTVNYEDPNFNIEIPIFSIHGNHDDPAGDGGLASLDLLAVTNLVNYFGKNDNIDDVTVYPILMRKGDTKVSIYGMGNIRDERLYRTFQQKKVKLMRPIEARDEWFNIFVIHQNRVAHSPKNYIHEVMLDNFLNFVVWGHEHECMITPQISSVGKYYIMQPGSSVATALSEGESKKKHVGLLEIRGDKFRLTPIPLKTTRPFIMEEIILSTEDVDPNDTEAVTELLASKVEEMIEKANSETENTLGMKPLIRLKVEYTGFTALNPQRFGQRFVGRVGNPNEILLYYKKRSAPKPKDKTDRDTVVKNLRPDPLDNVRVEDLIESFLVQSGDMQLLLESDLHLALNQFVEKGESDAISKSILASLKQMQDHLEKNPQLVVRNGSELDSEKILEMVTKETADKRATEAREPRIILTNDNNDDEEHGDHGENDEEEEKFAKPKKPAPGKLVDSDEEEKPKTRSRAKQSKAAPKKTAAPKQSKKAAAKQSKYAPLNLTQLPDDLTMDEDEQPSQKTTKKQLKKEEDEDTPKKRSLNFSSSLNSSAKRTKLSQLDDEEEESSMSSGPRGTREGSRMTSSTTIVGVGKDGLVPTSHHRHLGQKWREWNDLEGDSYEGYRMDVLLFHFRVGMADWVRFMEGRGQWGNHRWAQEIGRQAIREMNER